MPELNKPFITKVRDAIAQAPERRFDMSLWLDDSDWINDMGNTHEVSCGTTGCLAGWAVLVDSMERETLLHFNERVSEIVEDHKTIWSRAVELLGVDRNEDGSSELFTMDGWPFDFSNYDTDKEAVLALLDGLLNDEFVWDDEDKRWRPA